MSLVDELEPNELTVFCATLDEAGSLAEVDWTRISNDLVALPSDSVLRSRLLPVVEASAGYDEELTVVSELRDAADASGHRDAAAVLTEWVSYIEGRDASDAWDATDASDASDASDGGEYVEEVPPAAVPVRLWANGFDDWSDDNGETWTRRDGGHPEPQDGDLAWDNNRNDWSPYTPMTTKTLSQQVMSMDVKNTKVQLFWGDSGHLAKMALTRRELTERLAPSIPEIADVFQALQEQFLKDRKNPVVVPVLRDIEVGLVFDTQDLFDNFGRAFGTFAWMFNGQIPGDHIVASNRRVVKDNLSDLDAVVSFVGIGQDIVLDDGWGERAKLAGLARLFGGPTGTVTRTERRVGPAKRAALRVDAPDRGVWEMVKRALRAAGTDKDVL